MKYIKEKAEILADFGLTNTKAVEEYLYAKTANLSDKESKIRCIDIAARQLITDFYNGSTKFVDPICTLRQIYPRENIVSSASIIKHLGEETFNLLLEQGKLEYHSTTYHRKYYKF